MAYLVRLVLVRFAAALAGTVQGKVMDTRGGLVPGAELELIGTDTGSVTRQKTSGTGTYGCNPVAPGNYRVS